MGAVAKRYAKALFEVAKEKDELDLVKQELQNIQELLNQNPAFVQFLRHPLIEKQAKKEFIGKVFAGQLSQAMTGLLHLLIERDRENELEDIAAYYADLLNKERGVVDAVVTTVSPLSEEQEEQLRQVFGRITNKNVRLHPVVDPGILGGIKVKIGDRIYDGSVQGKLSRFERMIERTKS
ncbi:F-type H+-transporting ATPase subunit delta [Caldalkalibacillus uzonensis]|uniref:ATP synthase subunit delta n=1 Tax=Caldalkalibacillus uzonensis TaxID=353224 RepID=A0ABU0CTI7_9BACI|nr:F0F1 ATP synthase subunit delta [Caldalkalibacillus uzonensis]MDQ0339417.1 F-type H+-transporting ATPase subunit delta [Caldalkalibacillus uzonensis]